MRSPAWPTTWFCSTTAGSSPAARSTVLSRIDLPAAFADDAGVVVDTRVAAHEADDLTRLEFCGGAIFVSHRPEAIGTALRCRIHARDVSLALVPQTQSAS
jgi:molybdate transport system ATP-binding protein